MRINPNRSCGVLLHITSLPSPYGIGTLGKSAYEFVDFLAAANQKYWQILPIGPIGFGNSPYQSYSAFAGEPLLIDLADLTDQGLLARTSCDELDFGFDLSFVDYSKIIPLKMKLLETAFSAFLALELDKSAEYKAFVKAEEDWLDDYSVFMAAKEASDGRVWTEWNPDIDPDSDEMVRRIEFWNFTQYIFFGQWERLRAHANANGVKLIGDIPIYAAHDSADVWTSSDLFCLDDDGYPTAVAGVPPDYFSVTGQLWGNPLYNWDAMEESGFDWWVARFRKAAQLFDGVRIDHFRAFDTYYAVPYGHKTAENGEWLLGPGMKLFDALVAAGVIELPADRPPPKPRDPFVEVDEDEEEEEEVYEEKFKIIAEDLGELFPSVRELLGRTGFPGMRILQFGFNHTGADSEHLPHNYANNTVAYTGTHDNSTINGFVKTVHLNYRAQIHEMAKRYTAPQMGEPLNVACVRTLYASVADTVIVQAQDLLGLDDKARMNQPGKVLDTNWAWRMTEKHMAVLNRQAEKIRELTEIYFR